MRVPHKDFLDYFEEHMTINGDNDVGWLFGDSIGVTVEQKGEEHYYRTFNISLRGHKPFCTMVEPHCMVYSVHQLLAVIYP